MYLGLKNTNFQIITCKIPDENGVNESLVVWVPNPTTSNMSTSIKGPRNSPYLVLNFVVYVAPPTNITCKKDEGTVEIAGISHDVLSGMYIRMCSYPEVVEHEGGTDIDLDPDLGRVWEVCEDESQVVDVQGRLCRCIAFWNQELKASPLVLERIRVG